ncbi:TraB/GumN family protein [Neotabrizicola shimadae]|uniref:TraB/GumN family protein n=1 Tax=Neotabrizicola shimadae TaxID=2807096 RepID=A0A8G1A074_9RHOB|nr:TraB/GumN family protein [Neotabrizicola shimadae]
MPRRLIAAALALLALPAAAQAACTGTDLIAALPAETRAELTARAESVPFARGNFWQASRGDQTVTLVGTFHLDDPRHAETMAWLDPLIAGASTVLVEAGAQEEAALKARLAKEPDLLLQDGPTLPERLPPEDWARLSEALTERGVPAFMGARMKPWYLSAILAVPPCMMPMDQGMNGLDARVIEAAGDHGVPVRALEPYDTILGLFDSFTPEEEVALLHAAIAVESDAGDEAITTAAAYFRGDSQLLWEFSRHTALTTPGVDPTAAATALDETQKTLIDARNQAWIPVIEQAAAQGPVVAAFGALHLPGSEGVLNLLQRNGWTVTALAP